LFYVELYLITPAPTLAILYLQAFLSLLMSNHLSAPRRTPGLYHILLVAFVLLILLFVAACIVGAIALAVYVLKSGQVVQFYIWLDQKLNGYPAWVCFAGSTSCRRAAQGRYFEVGVMNNERASADRVAMFLDIGKITRPVCAHIIMCGLNYIC
jgi:hypothetical protein